MVIKIKLYTLLFFPFLAFTVCGQIPFEKLDKNLDFQERFYMKGELDVSNSFLYLDSNVAYRKEDLEELGIDPFDLKRVKHGKWISYYDKNWNQTDERKYEYYSLEEFEFGIIKGNAYYFSKDNKLHHSTQRYPAYFDSTFNGYRIVWYDGKERIRSVQYELFKSAQSKGYSNYTVYFPDGTIKSFSSADDRTASYHVVEFNKRGKILYELKNDEQTTYKLKQRLFGWIVIKETLEDGVNYKYRYVFGKLRKKKIVND